MPHAPKVLPKPKRSPATSPRRRGTTTERGYGWEHQQQRDRLLKERPVCERCRDAFSAVLHHRDRNPFNRSDANAEMLCEPCHKREHQG